MQEHFENSPQMRLVHLLMNKRKDIGDSGHYGELTQPDVIRLDKYIGGDIFGDTCVEWIGERKNTYSTLSFRRKKVSLLRLLYHNYIGDVEGVKIIQCEKTKNCCTISHIEC